jgi:hypothetical protein
MANASVREMGNKPTVWWVERQTVASPANIYAVILNYKNNIFISFVSVSRTNTVNMDDPPLRYR